MFLQDSGWQRVREKDIKLCFLHTYFALTLSLTSPCYAIVSLAALWTCVSCVVSRPECSPSATGRLEDNTVTGRGSPLASQTPATLPTLRPRACAGGIMRGRGEVRLEHSITAQLLYPWSQERKMRAQNRQIFTDALFWNLVNWLNRQKCKSSLVPEIQAN